MKGSDHVIDGKIVLHSIYYAEYISSDGESMILLCGGGVGPNSRFEL